MLRCCDSPSLCENSMATPGGTLQAKIHVSPECQGGSERPCSGNGHCSGDGSREGDGSCQCHVGYKGPLCMDCMDGYFSLMRNETYSICAGKQQHPDSVQLGLW